MDGVVTPKEREIYGEDIGRHTSFVGEQEEAVAEREKGTEGIYP